jgi:RNA recognition motif-containing protein
MASVADGEKAIAELNGTQFGGRTLIVNAARPRPEREGSGGQGWERRRSGGRW